MPQTRYANSDGVHIAYQVMGDGPLDLVYIPGWVSHLELEMDNPLSRRFYERLAEFVQLIRFDKRGTGMSDREMGSATLEDRVSDIGAVLDACNVERAALFGFSEGGTMAAVFAARHPERVQKLVLFASHAGRVTGSDDFPCGYEAEPAIRWMRSIVETRWGEGDTLEYLAPTMWRHPESRRAREWMARFERTAATPGAALAHFEFNIGNDARSILPSISAPTLVLHRAGDYFVPLCNGEFLASTIPDARLVVLDGDDHEPYIGDADRVLAEVETFLTGQSRRTRGRPWPTASAWDRLNLLTDAELRVARLVAEGLTNAAIAEALYLSRLTVESHLKHMYAKLGIESRVQLAAMVLNRGGAAG